MHIHKFHFVKISDLQWMRDECTCHGVESPGEGRSLGGGRQGTRHFARPVPVGRVERRLVERRGDQSPELGPETRLEALQMTFSLPPFGSAILEPNLWRRNCHFEMWLQRCPQLPHQNTSETCGTTSHEFWTPAQSQRSSRRLGVCFLPLQFQKRAGWQWKLTQPCAPLPWLHDTCKYSLACVLLWQENFFQHFGSNEFFTEPVDQNTKWKLMKSRWNNNSLDLSSHPDLLSGAENDHLVRNNQLWAKVMRD